MTLISGRGAFAGLLFHPLVPSLPPGDYLVRDFTTGQEQMPLELTGYKNDVGRYNEQRPAMYTEELFTSPDGPREMHMGIDIGGPVGMEICCVYDGVVHSLGYNSAAGDYGYVIVTEHVLNGQRVWALHGHLAATSVEGKHAGMHVRGGQVLGCIGGRHENGGWPPHVHFQLSVEEPDGHDMPGVVALSKLDESRARFPDPRLVLGDLYPDDGPFFSQKGERDAGGAHR